MAVDGRALVEVDAEPAWCDAWGRGAPANELVAGVGVQLNVVALDREGHMTGWDEVRGYLRGKYEVALEEPQRLGLVWKLSRATPAIDQLETVELVHAFGAPHVLVASDVAREDALSPLDAMMHNAKLAIGALALVGHRYQLRAVLPIAGVAPSVLDRALEFVAHEAARLRTRCVQPPVPAPYYD